MSKEISPSQFKFLLKSDPSYLLSFILDTEGPQIMNKLTRMGHSYVGDSDQAFDLISQWLNEGNYQEVVTALDVPLNPDNVAPAYQAALFEAAEEINAETSGLRTTIVNGNEGEGGAADSGGFSFLGQQMDSSNLLGALAGGLTGLMQGSNMQISQNQYGQYNPYNAPRRNNTMAWVLGGLGVLIVGFVLYKLFKN